MAEKAFRVFLVAKISPFSVLVSLIVSCFSYCFLFSWRAKTVVPKLSDFYSLFSASPLMLPPSLPLHAHYLFVMNAQVHLPRSMRIVNKLTSIHVCWL